MGSLGNQKFSYYYFHVQKFVLTYYIVAKWKSHYSHSSLPLSFFAELAVVQVSTNWELLQLMELPASQLLLYMPLLVLEFPLQTTRVHPIYLSKEVRIKIPLLL